MRYLLILLIFASCSKRTSLPPEVIDLMADTTINFTVEEDPVVVADSVSAEMDLDSLVTALNEAVLKAEKEPQKKFPISNTEKDGLEGEIGVYKDSLGVMRFYYDTKINRIVQDRDSLKNLTIRQAKLILQKTEVTKPSLLSWWEQVFLLIVLGVLVVVIILLLRK